MRQVTLSRRNLEALLSKLDRVKAGEQSACTIQKRHNPADGEYATSKSLDGVFIVAVEDEVLYANRAAGMIHPSDVKEVRHTTGEAFSGSLFSD
jgi:hypothetical protein